MATRSRSCALALLALCLLLLATGCGSVQEHRARQLRAAFSSSSAAERATMLAGLVEPGFVFDQVEIAWGPPDSTAAEEDGTTSWHYLGHQDAEGRFQSRHSLSFPRRRELLSARVIFAHGVVAGIEFAPADR